MKLVAKGRGRKNAEVGFKNAQDQADEQRNKLHYPDIELATTKMEVVDLKAKLKKAKKAALVAKAAADALE